MNKLIKSSDKGFSIVLTIVFLGIAVAAGFIGWYVWQQKNESSNSSEEICLQSYPEQCTKDGKTYLKY